jgi:hypothetical protein
MKKIKNIYAAILGISFVIWLFSSLITPFIDLYQKQTGMKYFLVLNTIIVLGFILTKVVPQSMKRNLDGMNFKIGSTKEKKPGCSSCKRKKRFD